jgi:hypothetical protein
MSEAPAGHGCYDCHAPTTDGMVRCDQCWDRRLKGWTPRVEQEEAAANRSDVARDARTGLHVELPRLQLGDGTAEERGGHDDPARRHLSVPGEDEADSSWAPVAKWWDGTASKPPEYLTRADGKSLLYSSSVNAIIGESGSGKTWLTLLALQQAGGGVFIDMEGRGPALYERIRPLGIAADSITYIRAREKLEPGKTFQDLARAMDREPCLVVLDGFNTLLEMQGLDYKETNQVTEAFRKLLEPVADWGHCLTLVDHTPHQNGDHGMLRAIGSQAKKAVITGTQLLVRAHEPFGRSKRGVAFVSVGKDKDGYVDELIQEGDTRKNVARFVLDARVPTSYPAELHGNDWASKEMRQQDSAMTIQGIQGWESMANAPLIAAFREAGGEMKTADLQKLIKSLKDDYYDSV